MLIVFGSGGGRTQLALVGKEKEQEGEKGRKKRKGGEDGDREDFFTECRGVLRSAQLPCPLLTCYRLHVGRK